MNNYTEKIVAYLKDSGYQSFEDINPYQNFKNVSIDELVSLMRFRLDNRNLETVDLYANKLLRFIEINSWRYKQKLAEKELAKFEKILFHNLLIFFLIQESLVNNDIRFLNTALKVNDVNIKGLINFSNKSIINFLKQGNREFITKAIDNVS